MTTSRSKERENALWNWLKKAGHRYFTPETLHMHRVENSVETGCPDMEGCQEDPHGSGVKSFWTELKSCPEPGPAGLVDVALTGEQQYWLFARDRMGGLAWLLVRVGAGSKRRHYLLHGGEYLKQVVKESVPEEWLFERSVMRTKRPKPAELLAQMAVRGNKHWDN